MIINLTSSNFTDIGGTYYSDVFKCYPDDNFISVQVTVPSYAVVNCQSSIDGVTFFDVHTTQFICSPNGLQSYKDCQPDLIYRLKSTTAVTSAKILM